MCSGGVAMPFIVAKEAEGQTRQQYLYVSPHDEPRGNLSVYADDIVCFERNQRAPAERMAA
jgi:hypothetical protein